MKQYELANRCCKEARLDFIGTFIVSIREMHHIIYIIFDHSSTDPRCRAHWLIRALITDCAAHG